MLIIVCLCTYCKAQKAAIIKWNTLENLLHQKTDTTYVINFWATWCKPCVAELPYFIEVKGKYQCCFRWDYLDDNEIPCRGTG